VSWEWLKELRDHWNDHYWRADHPEVTAVLVAILSGLVGLLFAYLQARMERHYRLPKTGDV
jgi:ABC-type Fe3+ transport system permease subunit